MKRILLLTAAACALSTSAFADETLKYRLAMHITASQSIPVADADGHALSVVSGQGLGFMADGGIVKTTFVSATDYVHGNGSAVVYYDMVFPDGSVLWIKGTGGRSTVKGDVTEFNLPLTVTSGKGKYAGANGDGLMTGIRASSLPTSGAELALDFTVNLKTGDQAEAAKAMLLKAVAAVKADRDVALAMFTQGVGGFRQGDLYPFCNKISDGKVIAGPVTFILPGTDGRTLKDSTGKPFGQEIFAAAQKPEGQLTEVTYTFPKAGTSAPMFQKVTYVTKVGDLICGVGYYK
jgi:hypothetical protein